MAGSLFDQLQKAQRALLDLSARNRLLNTPLGRGPSTRLDVVRERSTDVFRLLVRERREMSFGATESPAPDSRSSVDDKPRKKASGSLTAATDEAENADDEPVSDESESLDDSTDDDESSALPQPDEGGAVKELRFTDQVLETNLVSDKLQKRLRGLATEAKTFEEEQGVNCLFLALGFLEWYEAPSSDKPRFAPLVLIPVELHRKSANGKVPDPTGLLG